MTNVPETTTAKCLVGNLEATNILRHRRFTAYSGEAFPDGNYLIRHLNTYYTIRGSLLPLDPY
jgi:hypothetical protein